MPSGCMHRHRMLIGAVLTIALLLLSQPLLADYAVQVGVYKKRYYADQLINTLQEAGFPVEVQSVITAAGSAMTSIIVGPYPDRRTAAGVLARLKIAGKEGFIRKYSGDETKTQPARPTQQASEIPLPSAGMEQVVPAPAAREPTAALSPPSEISSPSVRREETISSPPLETPVPGGLFSVNEVVSFEPSSHLSGFFQGELAYAESSPQHLSKFRNTLELASQGHFTADMAWKVSGRVAYDAVFDLNDYYPTAVRDDQHLEEILRETYLDISTGDWDVRLGRQNIIWGEMVGLFFADVVSAKDMREFVLPEFDLLRIPQWAVRSEYFKGDFHGEAIWIPSPTYDNIGMPGAEFYPYPMPPPAGYGTIINGERRPAGSLTDSNYGLRMSYLTGGWDLSGFYYSSMDASPSFFREVVTVPAAAFVYTPNHTRIQQVGGTFSKELSGAVLRGGDLGDDLIGVVLKGEAVYTHDRWFEINQLSDSDGVVRNDTLDYAVGIDYSLPQRSRLNLQFFQRWYPNHDPGMLAEKLESGASIYATTHLSDALEAQFLWIVGINHGDWLARPKLEWTLSPQWRWVAGADFFNGASDGLFGRFANKDRLYTEVRFTF